MSDPIKVPGEGYVVTVGGARKDADVHVDESTAQVEAAKRKQKLQEQSGTAAPQVEVKKQLFG